MTFFRSSSAAVSSEKNLEQDTLLLKDIAAVRSDSPFACLRVGTLLPINAHAFIDTVSLGRKVGFSCIRLTYLQDCRRTLSSKQCAASTDRCDGTKSRTRAHQARALRHDNASGTLSGLRRIPCSSSRW